MKLMGSEGSVHAGHHPNRAATLADRPTFSLALALPVEWESLAGPPTDALLDRLERANSGVIATLLKCADLGTPQTEDEALLDAVAPLRVKIDMMMEMVARMAYREHVLPDPRPIELGLSHLRWLQPLPLPVDRWLLNKLYFHEVFREPIILAGRVASSHADAPGSAENKIEIDFAQMSENVSESFARLVFLEHRRQVGLRSKHHDMLRRA